MGTLSSKFSLRREKIIENLQSGGLVDILGYCNGDETEKLIAAHTAQNWGFRGKKANKENLVNLCTAAVAGQGKTELCRQLTLRTEIISRELSDLEVMVPIPISFNQCTSFSQGELNDSVEKAIIWRILYAFGNEEDCYKYQHSLRNLLRDIRTANISYTNTKLKKSVGIFLMVDEILKVRDADSKFFKLLLDELTSLQHRELHEELPTFVLLTSLELVPVSEQIIIGSWRKLQPIPIPFLHDLDLDVISSTLYSQFKTVLCAGQADRDAVLLDRFRNLDLLIRVAVSISGRHFRCLEEALKALYKRLVSTCQHEIALKVTNSPLSMAFVPNISVESRQRAEIFIRKEGDVDISIKEIFDSVVSQVEMTYVNKSHYEKATELFLKLIYCPNMLVDEKELYELETMKIVFVKYRDLERPAFIVPRVNLPFLFLYPRAERLSQCEPDDYEGESARAHGKETTYWRLKVAHPIKMHIEVLLGNIGAALLQSFSSLARTFEEVMIFAEVLTVAAHYTALPSSPMSILALENLIPEVIFKPWGNETLSVSPFVLQRPIRITCRSSSEALGSAAQTPVAAVQNAVLCASDVNSDVVYFAQGSINMERIEHVSRLFSVREKQVISLCSMKLREKSNPRTLALDLHKFVREKVRNKVDDLLADGSYYATIYCCAPKASIVVDNLPPGTIIVPYESVLQLLYPFGLSKLLFVAEDKYLASQPSLK